MHFPNQLHSFFLSPIQPMHHRRHALLIARPGQRRITRERIPHPGTYNANPLGMAAGLACLTKVMTDETYVEMERLATRLADGQRKIIGALGIPAVVTQVATLGGILFTPDEPSNFREAARCDASKWEDYWFGMLNRGVIPMGSAWFEEWSISAAHTGDDIDRTLEVTEEVLRGIFAA